VTQVKIPHVITLLRGTARIVAAAAGLLLIYGVIYTMEAITTRIPTSAMRELSIATLWMIPWVLLFCSGFDDLAAAANHPSVFWGGSCLILFLICYFERHTSSVLLTKLLMPLLVCAGGVLPHIFRRFSFLYTVFSVFAGVCGLVVLWYVLPAFVSPRTHFATPGVGFLEAAFILGSMGAGVLSVLRCRSSRVRAQLP
jgi:hypothetical protein